jgi:predicted O-methyltransferase YrrM
MVCENIFFSFSMAAGRRILKGAKQMIKKITVIIFAVVMVAVVGFLSAQELGGQQNQRRPRGFGPMRRGSSSTELSAFDKAPLANDQQEKNILNVLDDMAKNQNRGMMNVALEDGRLLRLLTEAVGAKNVVELGTSNGYSAIWFSLALRNTGGKLTTHEIDAHRASLARENFKRAGVDNLITLVEGDAHNEVTKIKEPIDILFLDADKEGYIDYLNKLLPLVRPGGLIIAHNITPGQADPKYVEAVTTNPDLESILLNGGVSVTLKKR